MFIFNFIALFSVTSLLTLTLASPFEPSLQHRQQGSCATAPCPKGLCCSKFNYCGTGADYCQAGSCSGGVGGTCAAGLCCSKYGYCGSGPEFCPPVVTTTSKVTTTTTTTSKKSTTMATTTKTSSTTTSASPTPSSVNCGTTGGPCAPGFCCSVWGWCGQGPLYCGS